MQESHSQSELKLPTLDDHTYHRLPIRLDPNFRLKYSNPIRIGYMKYLDSRGREEKLNDLLKAEREKNKRLQKQQKSKNTVPTFHGEQLRYLNPNDSDVNQDDVEQILKLRDFKMPYQVFISEQQQ